MKKLLLKSMLLLSALIVGSGTMWAQASVNTVLWSEDFSGYSADDVPSGSINNSHTGTTVYGGITLTYACVDGDSDTKVWTTGGPTGGTGNNLLIGKKNGSFSVTGISTGGATELTISYKKGGSGTVSISSSTSGVTISGSASGSTITTNGASTLQITISNTNKNNNFRIDDIEIIVKTAGSSVKAPTFDPAAGTVAYGTMVSLLQEDSKPIYFTTDGTTTPTKSSTLFDPLSPIEITNDMTIKAIAYDGDAASSVVTAAYTVQRPEYPTFSVEAGAVESGTEVTVTAAEGCTLYYTTDGTTDPTGAEGISAEARAKTFTISAAQTIKAASKDSHGFFSIVRTNAYTIDVFNDPTFSVADVIIEAGYSAIPTVTTNSSGTITYVSDDNDIATISDGKIVGVSTGTVTITANIAKDEKNKYRAASTTFEVTVTKATTWDSSSKGIDELTYSTLVSGSNGSYQTFSNKSFNSSAVYAGNAYKATTIDYIQIRTNNSNSGIVTTTSGGKARRVVVTWTDTQGSNGNTIDIYGKSTAYSAASDLYGANAGTKLGSIVRGTSTELLIGNNVEYIGIRSNNGTCYLDDIKIYWEGEAVSLSDASDYTPVAKDYAKVILNRSFVEGWNGIILPFKLTNDVKTALGVTKVKTLSSATESAGAITLNFSDVDLPVSAGTPVWVKFAAAKASGDVILNGVKLETTAPTNVAKTVASSTFTLTGTYSSTDLESSEAYFVSGTKFYHKAAGVPLTATPFRSYIIQTGASARVYFDLEDETTGIVEMNANNARNANQYYDLQGRKVAQPTKGLYIMNGKKVIIK